MSLKLSDSAHRRYNILTGEWVLVSPHRTKRPWQGQEEEVSRENRPSFDPNCYLCPGNVRASGDTNPPYTDTYVFDNDFGALLAEGEEAAWEDGLLKAQGERGICRVVCFSPDHSLTLPDMEVGAIEQVIHTWQREYTDLGNKDFIRHVQIFENKGAVMGCSNPHPHGQVWAQSSIPGEVLKKTQEQKKYWDTHQKSLLSDYLKQELSLKERIICQSEDFVALVPFWALWPFEAMIVPLRHMQDISQMETAEVASFAKIIKELTQRYDQLFGVSFPYSSGIHQRPCDGEEHAAWHWHMVFYPPLLRSAHVKKFMVGYEMFAEPQRDITAEMAAKRIREAI